jgi:hypothetical protein
MSDEKVLTKEVAEQFLADEDSVDLSEFTVIEDVAAESLSKHEGELYLSGLSDAAAESLSKHEGEWLDLSGLTSLSDAAAAESLSRHKGGLNLGSLKSLSDAAAESLSKHKGDLKLWAPGTRTGSLRCRDRQQTGHVVRACWSALWASPRSFSRLPEDPARVFLAGIASG